MQAAAFLVARAPGAGKCTLAELLPARLDPAPALFPAGARMGAAPVVAHREIDNRNGAPGLTGQVDALVAALVDRRRPSITPVR